MMTSSFNPNFVIGTVLLIGLLWCCVVSGSPNMEITKEVCSGTTYAADDPYQNSVSYVLNDVMTVTPTVPGYSYSDTSPGPTSPAFGFGRCGLSLSAADCATCMVDAFTEIQNQCTGHTVGAVILTDCSIGYTNVLT